MARRKARAAATGASTTQFRRLATVVQRLTAMVGQLSDEVADGRDERRIQLQRIAQMQAELDTIKKAWEKMRGE